MHAGKAKTSSSVPILTAAASPDFAEITRGWQPTRFAGQSRLPFANPEAGCYAGGTCRLQALQQIGSCLFDERHAGRIGKGAHIELDKYLAATRPCEAAVETPFQRAPVGDVLANARAASSCVPARGVPRVKGPSRSVSKPVTSSMKHPSPGSSTGAMTPSFPCRVSKAARLAW